MNKILDTIVSNNLIFGGILVFLGIVLILLIVSIVKSSKKMHKIPIYEEDMEDKELEDVKEENIIDKPAKKKPKKKPVSKEIVEEDAIEESEEEEEKKEELSLEELVEEDSNVEIENDNSNEESDDELSEEIIEEEYDEEKIAELESIDEEEIKERIDKEHEEAIEETMEEIDNEEMNDALRELKDAKEVKPEDVVRQFEQEQEAQSIISYQELVDVVKNRDKDFEDELESKPLATVSDFLPDTEGVSDKEDSDMAKLIEELGKPKQESDEVEELTPNDTSELEDIEEVSLNKEDSELEESSIETASSMVKEAFKEIPQDGKFKKTELISPVFGRIKEEPEESYPTVKKFSHEDEEEIEEMVLPEEVKDDTIEAQATEIEEIEDISEDLEEEQETEALFEEIPNDIEKTAELGLGDISKNEEFLKALKDFRDSL